MKDSTLKQQLHDLYELFKKEDKTSKLIQLQLSKRIIKHGLNGELQLISLLKRRLYSNHQLITYVDGSIYELLLNSNIEQVKSDLEYSFPKGIVTIKSNSGIDYTQLQKLLIQKKFQEADSLTQLLLCQLSQVSSGHSRSWLYFTDIKDLPKKDLQTIDQLWQIHSIGLFGLSVQREIWLSANANWDIFWCKIGWTKNNMACRYPKEFTWTLNAPPGHLPLFNQIRGVQVLTALFEHSAWGD